MKKKAIIYALFASAFVTGLTACGAQNDDNNNTINVESKKDDGNKYVESEPTYSRYLFEDDDKAIDAYKEVKNYYKNLEFDEFMKSSQREENIVGTVFKYFEIEILIKNDGTIEVKDNRPEKKEYTYDTNGNVLSYVLFRRVNNEWLKIAEYKFINNSEKCVYHLFLNDANQFEYKNETTYDENGNWLESIDYKYENGEWINNSKSDCTYDEQGNVLTNTQYIYKNGDWFLREGTTYVDGKVKTEIRTYENSSGIYKNETTFNSKDTETVITSKLIDNTWVYETKTEHKYDANRKELEEIWYDYKNGEWVNPTKYEYTYDSNGNITNEFRYSYLNDEWIKTYDAIFVDGIKKEKYSISINDGVLYIKNEYTYDENWNLVKVTDSEYKNDEWKKMSEYIFINGESKETFRRLESYGSYGTAETISEYTYDESGNELSYICFVFINNEWVKITESRCINDNPILKDVYDLRFNQDGTFAQSFEYTYDENGNIISTTNIVYTNNEIDYKRVDICDEKGKILTETYYNYENNTWVYSTKWEYTYDESGNKLSYTSFSFINNEWVKIYEGKLINGEMKVLFRIWLNQDGSFYQKGEYTYDESGQKTSETYYEFINNKWLKTRYREYENSIERYSLGIRYKEDGTFDYKYDSIYDKRGNELESIDYYYRNDAWVYNVKWEYTYDENGNELTQAYYKYENGKWVKY